MNDEGLVIFLHIPKAGGSTLRKILKEQYTDKEVYEVVSRRRQTNQNLQKMLDLPEEQKLDIKLVQGHFSFGIHHNFPQVARYITMLRNPCNRAISAYTYASTNPNHFLYKRIKDEKMSLADFIGSDLGQNDSNRMVHRLSGACKEDLNSGALALAKHNINEHFSSVGFTENFDESLLLFKDALGWKSVPTYTKVNITERKGRQKIDKDVLQQIEAVNALDMDLYHWAKDAFDKEIIRRGEDFKSQLLDFNNCQQEFDKTFKATRTKIFEKSKARFLKIKRNF